MIIIRVNVLKQCSTSIKAEPWWVCGADVCFSWTPRSSSPCVSSIFAFLKNFRTFCSSKFQRHLSDNTQNGVTSIWAWKLHTVSPQGFLKYNPSRKRHHESFSLGEPNKRLSNGHDLFNHWLTRSAVFDLCLHPLGSQRFQPYMRGSAQGPAALWLMLRENRGNWAWDAFKGRFTPLLCVLNPLIVQ